MNDLTVIAASLNGDGGKPVTMTSLEISRLVESNHADVRRSIERLSTRGVITLPPTAEVSNDGPGPKTISVYSLCKRDSLIVVAQICPEFTARVVDRWQELEEQVAKPALNPANLSRLQLIELAMQAEQERLVLEAKVGELAPKAEALDRISTADVGSLCITNAAKALQVPPKKLFSWMQEHQWIYRRAGNSGWIAYQHRIQCGWLEHKVTTVERSDGTEKVVEQVLVTPKGLAKLSAFVELKGLPA